MIQVEFYGGSLDGEHVIVSVAPAITELRYYTRELTFAEMCLLNENPEALDDECYVLCEDGGELSFRWGK